MSIALGDEELDCTSSRLRNGWIRISHASSFLCGTRVTTGNFRPVIVIDKCPAWDEDRWLDLQIGETKLQCFKPCNRCVLITVDPVTGVKDNNTQPLRKLREFRLAPEGKLREFFKDSPIFGVSVGVDRPGYIHVGQVVYARYKKSAF
ncbi:hypothetical protein Q1695_006037 [Nippostrongylus brasiliensis]|nr:hypothetical protein Q1695_006037 [Nippostrongylus brasiliensis]